MNLFKNLSKITLKQDFYKIKVLSIQRNFTKGHIKIQKREQLDLKLLKQSFQSQNSEDLDTFPKENISNKIPKDLNKNLSLEEQGQISDKNIYEKDIALQHSKDTAMIKKISLQPNLSELFKIFYEKNQSLNNLAYLFYKIIIQHRQKLRANKLVASLSQNKDYKSEKIDSQWDRKEFNEICEKIYLNIENFNPTSINAILNGLIRINRLNVIGVNIHTMVIRWLSTGENLKFQDNEQLSNALINLARISYLQDKFQLINTKEIAKSISNILQSRLTYFNTIVLSKLATSTYKSKALNKKNLRGYNIELGKRIKFLSLTTQVSWLEMNLTVTWELNEKHILKLFNYIVDKKVCEKLHLKNLFYMQKLRKLAADKKLFDGANLLKEEIDKSLYNALDAQIKLLFVNEEYSLLKKKSTLLKMSKNFESIDLANCIFLENFDKVLLTFINVIFTLIDTKDIEVLPDKHILKNLPQNALLTLNSFNEKILYCLTSNKTNLSTQTKSEILEKATTVKNTILEKIMNTKKIDQTMYVPFVKFLLENSNSIISQNNSIKSLQRSIKIFMANYCARSYGLSNKEIFEILDTLSKFPLELNLNHTWISLMQRYIFSDTSRLIQNEYEYLHNKNNLGNRIKKLNELNNSISIFINSQKKLNEKKIDNTLKSILTNSRINSYKSLLDTQGKLSSVYKWSEKYDDFFYMKIQTIAINSFYTIVMFNAAVFAEKYAKSDNSDSLKYISKDLDEVFGSLSVIGFKSVLKNYLRETYLTKENLLRLNELIIFEQCYDLKKLNFYNFQQENSQVEVIKSRNESRSMTISEKLKNVLEKLKFDYRDDFTIIENYIYDDRVSQNVDLLILDSNQPEYRNLASGFQNSSLEKLSEQLKGLNHMFLNITFEESSEKEASGRNIWGIKLQNKHGLQGKVMTFDELKNLSYKKLFN